VRRDLYISAFAPTLGSGRALRTYCCARALALLGPVDMAYVPLGGEGPSPEYQAVDGLTFHEVRPSRGPRRARTYVGKRLRGVPEQYARGVSAELIEVGERLADHPQRGRVVLGDLHASVALLPLARRRQVIYNAHNLESAYRHAAHGKRIWTHLAIRRLERRLLRTAGECWMVSRPDMAAAAALVPGARLRYVPNAVDVEAIRPVPPRTGGTTVLMVGDFAYPPNRSGLAFLAEAVMPRVWRALPDARLRLVGRALGGEHFTDPRIDVAGFVANLDSAYSAADCVAVPLVEGAGTPLKFVEALAYQVPVVATPLAARGLEAEAGEHYLEGADAERFAAAVIDVLSKGAAEIARRGRRLAELEHSIPSLSARIAA
jgi:glycosyltransferase involved in cell wall biosynthesis